MARRYHKHTGKKMPREIMLQGWHNPEENIPVRLEPWCGTGHLQVVAASFDIAQRWNTTFAKRWLEVSNRVIEKLFGHCKLGQRAVEVPDTEPEFCGNRTLDGVGWPDSHFHRLAERLQQLDE